MPATTVNVRPVFAGLARSYHPVFCLGVSPLAYLAN